MRRNPRQRARVLLFLAGMLCHRAAELKPSLNERDRERERKGTRAGTTDIVKGFSELI